MLGLFAGQEFVVGHEGQCRLLRQPQMEAGMGIANRLGLSGGGEPGQGELADRLQQPVADPVRLVVRHHQRLVDKGREQIEHLQRFDVTPGRDGLGGIERESAGEDGQTLQHRPLVLAEQVVAPLHRGSERLLTGETALGTSGQEPEPVVEPLPDAFG